MIITGSERTEFHQVQSDIRRYLHDARQIMSSPAIRGGTKDRRDWYARCMVSFALINRTLDLGFLILDLYGYGDQKGPVRYKAMIKRLHDHHLIDDNIKDGMIALIEQRNRISHHFHTMKPGDVWTCEELFFIVEAFTDAMEQAYAGCTVSIMTKRILITAGVVCLVIGILMWFFWA